MQKKGEGGKGWKTTFQLVQKQLNLHTSTNQPSLLLAAAALGKVMWKRDTVKLNTKAMLISCWRTHGKDHKKARYLTVKCFLSNNKPAVLNLLPISLYILNAINRNMYDAIDVFDFKARQHTIVRTIKY